MLTQFILDSFLFWTFLSVIVITAIWIGRAAIRIFEYERQVDRGWNDLLDRADKTISKLDELIYEVQKIKSETEEATKKVRKIKTKLEE